jgi:hypothetical protein
MIIHEQVFWIVAWAFYFFPHIKFIERSEGFVFVSLKGRSAATFVSNPFETIRGVLCLINPLVPYRAVFRCRWGVVDASPHDDVRRSWAHIRKINKQLHGVRILAAMGWLVLFVAGPTLTWQIGLGQTLLLLAPVWLSLYAGVAYILLTADFHRSKMSVSLILFECLVCPGYLPALPKILTSDIPLSVDMTLIVRRYGEPNAWAKLKAALEKRIDAELYYDPSLETQLSRYRAEIMQ